MLSKIWIFIISGALLALPNSVFAQNAPKKVTRPAGASGKGENAEGVLDFEGEVIEGQRKRPDLFLQTEIQNLTLDAILYLRRDFNDFHQVERYRRPGYFDRRTKEAP